MSTRPPQQLFSRRELVVVGARLIAGGVALRFLGCSREDGGEPQAQPDAAPLLPDAAPPSPDAAPPSPDAAPPSPDAGSVELELPARFTELESMRIVGRKYLELHPEATLLGLLTEIDAGRGFDALEVELRNQYASGDVVGLDGWPVALTEARICAIVALRS